LFYSTKTADVDFFNSFNRNIENALEITDNIVLLGDLNEDLLNPNFHNLKNIMLINSLKNIVKEPTRINALLDPILINHDMTYLHSGALALPQYISDHKATFVCLPFSYDTGCSYKRIIWLYNKADFNSLNHMIGSHDWSFLECKTLTLDEACLQFTKVFNDFVKKCIPNKTVLIKPNDKPWFDGTIKRYIRIRNRLKKIAIKSNKTNDWGKYKTMRNQLNNSKKHAKEHFFSNLEVNLINLQSNDKRGFWKVIRYFMKNVDSTSAIPPLSKKCDNGDTQLLLTNIEKANFLNDFFVSVSSVDDTNVN
jgi:hypothetical protein